MVLLDLKHLFYNLILCLKNGEKGILEVNLLKQHFLKIICYHWVQNAKNSLIAYIVYFCRIPNEFQELVKRIQNHAKSTFLLISSASHIILYEHWPLVVNTEKDFFLSSQTLSERSCWQRVLGSRPVRPSSRMQWDCHWHKGLNHQPSRMRRSF